MYWADIECDTNSSMFLHGYDQKKPELGTPPYKTLMRFWWRSLHGKFSIKQLY